RDPLGILTDPSLRALVDFAQPIAVLLVAVLDFVSDEDDPYGIVHTLMDAVPAGSYLVISHFTADSYPQAAARASRVYSRSDASLHGRTRAQVAGFFDGYDLICPGDVVWTPQWQPDADTGLGEAPAKSLYWCGVARKS